MHEMAICQALIRQLEQLAADNGGGRIRQATLRVGPLSGVEAPLLDRAFAFARRSSQATADTALVLESATIEVRCNDCGERSAAAINRLLCACCGSWRTRVTAGDELLLMRVELERLPLAVAL